jgi:signal transduction histidine kinase
MHRKHEGRREKLCVQLSALDAESTSRAALLRLRRVFLIGAAIIPAFVVLDYFNISEHRGTALALRCIWGCSSLAFGLAIPHASPRGVRVLLAAAAGTSVVLLTLLTVIAGGTTGQYFQYLVAMPMCVAVCLPVEMLAAIVASVAALACGVTLMLWEGKAPGAVVMRWAMLCAMSGGLAVFASATYRRLHAAERRASVAREEDLRRIAAVVAHEINNQLGVLQNTIALLGKQSVESSVLALQQESVDQMRELTMDFLRYGTGVRGPKESVDLVHLAYAYAQAFAPHVEVTSAPDRAIVEGDRTRIARALLNVLKNGVEAGGPVEVTVDKRSDGVGVRVIDCGPGVAADVASRIGEPFFTTKARGTGLGLALVKQVVHEHHGRFSMYNRDEGGVSAEIWFPHMAPKQDVESTSPIAA